MMQVNLAKACRRREIGAPMTVTERAAYRMMITGEVRPDPVFMAAFEKAHGIQPAKIQPTKPAVPQRKWGRPRKETAQ